MPSSATAATNHNTVQHSPQRHHTYESEEEEEEEEEEGKGIHAATGAVPPSALPIPWRPEVPPGGAHIHGAQRTAAGTDTDASYMRCGPAREATSGRGQEEHSDYGEVLHLLHALHYLVSRSAAPLVDHLIAQFLDLKKRDR
jgi:hypothetical protein